MTESLRQAAEQIVSGAVGQAIDKTGYAAIGTGLGIKAAETAAASGSYIESMLQYTITEWAAVASILGVASMVAKNIFEVWWRIRETKRNERLNSK